MADFIYTATISSKGARLENIPVFAFGVGGPEEGFHGWDSTDPQIKALASDVENRVAGNRELTIVVPVPVAMQYFGMQAQIEELEIFGSKPATPHISEFKLEFEG